MDNTENILTKVKNIKFKNILSEYWVVLVLLVLLIVIIVLFSVYGLAPLFPNTQPGWSTSIITAMETYKLHLGNKLVNCSICEKYLSHAGKEIYRLSDFYVLSSYKSALTGGYKRGFVSIDAITKILEGGVRYIDLDVFNKEMKANTEPVVSVGSENGYWNDSSFNAISFDACCKEIARIAFNSNEILNSNDPLFLSINLYTLENKKTVNKIADIIYKYFKEKLLSAKYSYQQTPIGRVPISILLGKVIIFAGNPITKPNTIILPKNNILDGTKLDELTNYTWNLKNKKGLQKLAHKDEVFEVSEPKNLVCYNKTNISIVYPYYKDDMVTPKNYNPQMPFILGCQFISMNFQTIDKNIEKYLSKFILSKDSGTSFILKPEKLRYKRPHIDVPPPQKKSLRLDRKFETESCPGKGDGVAGIQCGWPGSNKK